MDSKERLVARLKGIRLLGDKASESALRSVNRSAFMPPELEALGDCDAPVPCRCGKTDRFVPSYRFMALLLEALDLSEGQRVAVIDSRGGYVAAVIAAAMRGKGTVTAVEFELTDEEEVLRNLEEEDMADEVDVMSVYAFMAKSGTFTRVLLMADDLMPADIVSQVAEDGFVLSRGGPEGLALARHVRGGDDLLEILYGDASLIGPRTRPNEKDATMNIDVSRILGLEDIMSHVWTGKFSAEKEETVAELVMTTLEGGPLEVDPRAEKSKKKLAAEKAFHAGYLCQSMGYLEDAEDLYKASLRILPSAEAHTFLGWRLSFDGHYKEAIEECRKAMEIDPTLGNPYNDTGAYLIELGCLEEAVSWLLKALKSERYCCYCYAHCNLGRAYLMMGKRELARKELETALMINPDYDLAKELLDRIGGGLDYFG